MLVSVVGVGVHWLNVTMRSLYVQWVKFFKLCLFEVLCFPCNVHTRMISYTFYIILLHVHLNEHTQQALCPSVECPLFAFCLSCPTNHRPNVILSSILSIFAPKLCINLTCHINFMHHDLYGTSCITGKGLKAIISLYTCKPILSHPLHPF